MMLPDGIGSFVGSFVVGSGFKVVIYDVVKQCAVPEMPECRDIFCHVLKETA